MGKKRVPLAMQKGNLTVEQQTIKEQEEAIVTVGREDLAAAPSWLIDRTAKAEFRRLVKEFEKIDVIGNLDLNNLGGYCNAYSFYLQATKELKSEPLIVTKTLPNGAKQRVENPLIKIQKNYADEMRKFAGLCGLTIDSRLKCATAQRNTKEDEIIDTFGDI